MLSWHSHRATLHCVIVDDRPEFPNVARKVLEREGIAVVGVASTSAEALERVTALEPDVVLIDIDLGDENGFELARRLGAHTELQPMSIIMISAGNPDDFAAPVAVSPALGFLPKLELSADAVRAFLADQSHGHACRHEALVYGSTDEFAAGAVPFLREGLARGDRVLVVLREGARTLLQDVLAAEADRVEFADAVEWYRSPAHAFEGYTRYLGDQFGRGAQRVRVVAEVVWPAGLPAAEVAGWKRYEAGISLAMAAVPVSFICTYDTQELPEHIVADALRTHPLVRTGEGARPSSHYIEPGAFIRELETH